jgi:hypothetical protein
MRTPLLPVALLLALPAFSQTLAPLTVGKIMRDPAQWLGTSPSDIQWSEDSKTIYFKWNPERRKADSLYAVSLIPSRPAPWKPAVRRSLPAAGGTYNRGKTERVYARDGDVYWLDARTGPRHADHRHGRSRKQPGLQPRRNEDSLYAGRQPVCLAERPAADSCNSPTSGREKAR